MTRRRHLPRNVRQDERALWDQVAASARPLRPEQMRDLLSHTGEDTSAPVPEPVPDRQHPQPVQPFTITGSGRAQSGASITYAPPSMGDAEVRMDRKRFKRMKQGRLPVEARIDLHGMTLARAHPALIGFVTGAYRDQLRLVLVITGKGKDRDTGGPIPTRRGVLRHQVPDWLRMAPLAPMVLQITQANQKDGGAGAWYVYLRRSR